MGMAWVLGRSLNRDLEGMTSARTRVSGISGVAFLQVEERSGHRPLEQHPGLSGRRLWPCSPFWVPSQTQSPHLPLTPHSVKWLVTQRAEQLVSEWKAVHGAQPSASVQAGNK